MIRQIKDLLYEQGFTISGARAQLTQNKGKAAEAAAHNTFNKKVVEQLQEVLEILQ
jgi:DNA-binding transcriptional MerR regulator